MHPESSVAPGFVEPQHVTDLSECWFYHSMNLPDVGEVRGHWDLRPTVDAYLGHLDYAGKRVLDIGAASGYLSFAMEERGAQVISLDIGTTAQRDVIPYVQARPDGLSADDAADLIERELAALHRGYWFTHRALGSRARVYHGKLAQLDHDVLGEVDVVFAGMVLPHIRDPFAALESLAALRPREIVITQQMPQTEHAIAYFLPDARQSGLVDAWWSPSAACLDRMLTVLGYSLVHKEDCAHLCVVRGDSEVCTTLVARKH